MESRTCIPTWPLLIAVFLSIASALCYLASVGQGVVVGALVGLRGREYDVAIAQMRADWWEFASALCVAGSALAASLSTSLFSDAERLPRFIGRFLVGLVAAVGLTAVLVYFAFAIVAAFHRRAIV